MRIAYVTINVAVKIMTGGVGSKIKRQAALWREAGHIARVFSLTPDAFPFPDSEQFVFRTITKLPFVKTLLLEFSRSFNLHKMIRTVREYRPDVIYLRFGLYTFPLQALFKIAPVFMEVNTNDLEEYKTRGAFFYWMNRLTRGIVFSRVTGLVPVSEELADLNAGFGVPTCVVSNGIDLSSFVPFPPPESLSPVLMAIGSPGMSWQGMDKLFAFARCYPDLTIHIVGSEEQDFSESIPSNLHVHGYVPQPQIKEILAQAHVVFGQLALHRKNMKENPALKTREALAYGIPVILAHPDADLMGLDTDLILFIPNTEDNLVTHGDVVRDFAYRVMDQRIDRGLIEARIDQRFKEQQRLAFFEEILSKRKA
jgi:Glycosyltransferase Family 4/Glycosyl transferases group 1